MGHPLTVTLSVTCTIVVPTVADIKIYSRYIDCYDDFSWIGHIDVLCQASARHSPDGNNWAVGVLDCVVSTRPQQFLIDACFSWWLTTLAAHSWGSGRYNHCQDWTIHTQIIVRIEPFTHNNCQNWTTYTQLLSGLNQSHTIIVRIELFTQLSASMTSVGLVWFQMWNVYRTVDIQSCSFIRYPCFFI